MRADIHDGQEHKRSTQGPDTEAQDQLSPDSQIPLATHGRSIQMGQERHFGDDRRRSAHRLNADMRNRSAIGRNVSRTASLSV